MIGWPAMEQWKNRSYIKERTLIRQLIAVYGCNGTEFSYVIFIEQRNFTTVERRNGNGRTATEWWKLGITVTVTYSCGTTVAVPTEHVVDKDVYIFYEKQQPRRFSSNKMNYVRRGESARLYKSFKTNATINRH